MTIPSDEFLAGFFDADGAIGITPGSRTSLYLLGVQVIQVDATILQYFKDRFAGKVTGPYYRGHERRRPIYRWSADAKSAAKFLEVVAPFLVVKRERAFLALEFRFLFEGSNVLGRGNSAGNLKKRERILQERHSYYVAMRTLNRRGTNLASHRPINERWLTPGFQPSADLSTEHTNPELDPMSAE